MNTCAVCGVESERWRRCDEHYRCDSCGTSFENVQLIFARGGVYCDPCLKKKADEDVANFKGSTYYTPSVVCPHCGYEYSDSWEMEEGDRECGNCERKFEMSRHHEVTYSTHKVE